MRLAQLSDAAMALYTAGHWTLRLKVKTVDEQTKLWEDLREALDLDPSWSNYFETAHKRKK